MVKGVGASRIEDDVKRKNGGARLGSTWRSRGIWLAVGQHRCGGGGWLWAALSEVHTVGSSRGGPTKQGRGMRFKKPSG
jgi:hypothetical protein